MNKVSVVTVNYNNSRGLEDTIKSVLSQTYKNIEFIIVDGGSTDSSLEVIKRYRDQIDFYVSEKDAGIYDAMNKGIKLATGSWINFMNSGDKFHEDDSISKVFSHNISDNINLVYGSQYKLGEVVPPLPSYFIKLGIIPACHQAMFFRPSIEYDLRYNIYADFDLVANIYQNKESSIKFVDVAVCEFEGGGVSSLISREKRIDKYLSLFRHFGFKYVAAALFHRFSLLLIK